MRILIVTNMWPSSNAPVRGIFVAEQVRSLEARGHDVSVVSLERPGRRTRYAWGIVEVAKAVSKHRPQIVHAHYGFSGVVASLQRAAPLVVTYHGSDVHVDWQRKISLLAARRAAANIFVSQRQRELLPAKHSWVLPCGVDPVLFHPRSRPDARRELGLDPAQPVLLFAGAFKNAVKNYPLLAAALAEAPRTECFVQEMAGISRDLVPVWMAAADALVMTSISEGSPMVVKEALFMQLPIVSTAVGDVPDRIGNVDGCHVVASESGTVRRAIDAVLKRRERLRDDSARADLSLDRVAERLEAIYADVLG